MQWRWTPSWKRPSRRRRMFITTNIDIIIIIMIVIVIIISSSSTEKTTTLLYRMMLYHTGWLLRGLRVRLRSALVHRSVPRGGGRRQLRPAPVTVLRGQVCLRQRLAAAAAAALAAAAAAAAGSAAVHHQDYGVQHGSLFHPQRHRLCRHNLHSYLMTTQTRRRPASTTTRGDTVAVVQLQNYSSVGFWLSHHIT